VITVLGISGCRIKACPGHDPGSGMTTGIVRIWLDTERDLFMSSEDALKYGIVDNVITKREIQAESKKIGKGVYAKKR